MSFPEPNTLIASTESSIVANKSNSGNVHLNHTATNTTNSPFDSKYGADEKNKGDAGDAKFSAELVHRNNSNTEHFSDRKNLGDSKKNGDKPKITEIPARHEDNVIVKFLFNNYQDLFSDYIHFLDQQHLQNSEQAKNVESETVELQNITHALSATPQTSLSDHDKKTESEEALANKVLALYNTAVLNKLAYDQFFQDPASISPTKQEFVRAHKDKICGGKIKLEDVIDRFDAFMAVFSHPDTPRLSEYYIILAAQSEISMFQFQEVIQLEIIKEEPFSQPEDQQNIRTLFHLSGKHPEVNISKLFILIKNMGGWIAHLEKFLAANLSLDIILEISKFFYNKRATANGITSRLDEYLIAGVKAGVPITEIFNSSGESTVCNPEDHAIYIKNFTKEQRIELQNTHMTPQLFVNGIKIGISPEKIMVACVKLKIQTWYYLANPANGFKPMLEPLLLVSLEDLQFIADHDLQYRIHSSLEFWQQLRAYATPEKLLEFLNRAQHYLGREELISLLKKFTFEECLSLLNPNIPNQIALLSELLKGDFSAQVIQETIELGLHNCDLKLLSLFLKHGISPKELCEHKNNFYYLQRLVFEFEVPIEKAWQYAKLNLLLLLYQNTDKRIKLFAKLSPTDIQNFQDRTFLLDLLTDEKLNLPFEILNQFQPKTLSIQTALKQAPSSDHKSIPEMMVILIRNQFERLKREDAVKFLLNVLPHLQDFQIRALYTDEPLEVVCHPEFSPMAYYLMQRMQIKWSEISHFHPSLIQLLDSYCKSESEFNPSRPFHLALSLFKTPEILNAWTLAHSRAIEEGLAWLELFDDQGKLLDVKSLQEVFNLPHTELLARRQQKIKVWQAKTYLESKVSMENSVGQATTTSTQTMMLSSQGNIASNALSPASLSLSSTDASQTNAQVTQTNDAAKSMVKSG